MMNSLAHELISTSMTNSLAVKSGGVWTLLAEKCPETVIWSGYICPHRAQAMPCGHALRLAEGPFPRAGRLLADASPPAPYSARPGASALVPPMWELAAPQPAQTADAEGPLLLGALVHCVSG